MAEVLGGVASGIAVTQLATQITSSIIKLKNYWAQIKDVPTEIIFLLREIDSLNLILCHIQQEDRTTQWGQYSTGDNLCLEQSLDLCQQGSAELQNLVDEFASKIEKKHGVKRKFASAKIALKSDETKRLKRRMKSAIRLLSLSYQCHTNQNLSSPKFPVTLILLS
ncbi:hypothetical protein LSUE1_G006273 [Lachnellula suecica]|uniref:Fungal N-terminal domain-containing protein n=1 Tax=Lachnellula suecica TaxID=602035 RepID=A0A8T9C6D3_9HELO|nr:hypothetical protein LSUE1_G006273 [Lachnellula suecica]